MNKKYHKEYHRKWYEKNKLNRGIQIRKRRALIKKWFVEHRQTLKCKDCGENHPATLDFHHVGGKIIEIVTAIRNGWSIENIKREMKKCVVLCSNCHRKRHSEVV